MFCRLLLTFTLVSGIAWSREPLDHPNVVLIYLDDSGYGDYSYNGNPPEAWVAFCTPDMCPFSGV